MTSTIKVNNIQNQCGQNIINENSNTITLGASGDTITLASGASQSGFGREGSVDWQTGSIKTTTFTAVSGEGYFVDTSSGAVTANLPAGTAGAIVAFADYTRTFGTNALTIVPNGSNKIGGIAANSSLIVNGQSATFVFVDATEGWINVQETQSSQTGQTFITATGGTVTCSGNFKIHTFTGPGTFQVTQLANSPACNQIDYLVVAGGGGGGSDTGSGGGAGGFRVSNDTCMPSPQTSPLANSTGLTASIASFPITIGAGGSVGPADGTAGGASTFSTITSAGGGQGRGVGSNQTGAAGGSGSGGRGGPSASTSYPGGAGNTPPVSPPQGNPGGGGGDGVAHFTAGGSGGGASAAGGNATAPGSSNNPGFVAPGGAGSFVVQTGFAGCNGTPGPVSGARYFSGGGGGGLNTATPGAGGDGGAGGGGQGGQINPSPRNATAGTANTGGGGGGDKNGPSGGAGGSGIVIIRYKYQ